MSSEIPKSHSSPSDADDKQKRLKKYDKFNTHSLRRDLLLSKFDRTLVVEKAKFEPTASEDSLITQTQSAPIVPTQHTDALLPKMDVLPNDESHTLEADSTSSPPAPMPTYALTMSPSAPTLSSTAGNSNNSMASLLTSNPLTTSHSVNDHKRRLTPVKSENNGTVQAPTPLRPSTSLQHNRKVIKKQSKPVMNGTASPAEVFHRNLVDAVSNVEDSDENEHYVYPYSGNESNAPGIHRPLSVRSTPASLLDSKKRSRKGFGEWLRQTLYNKPPQPPVDEEEEDPFWSSGEQQQQSQQRRPKLRNHVKDHQQQQSNKSSLLNLWHDSFNKKYANPLSKKSSAKKYYSSQKHSPPYIGHGNRNGGYTSDDEEAPLLLRRQKRSFSKPKKTCTHTLQNLVLSLILLVILLLLMIVYKAQPLMELSVDMGRVLATDKELIFDLKVRADNWNWWTIHVADADISVFAFSQIVPSSSIIVTDMNSSTIRGVDPAEYLGGLTHFDEPLSIPSNRFHSDTTLEAVSQIRIKSPGADTAGNERWSRMIRYPYGLVVRGVLKYKPIPFLLGTYPQSVAICNVTQVDPTTGAVSASPDKTICASEDKVSIFSHGRLTGTVVGW
ncbi:hypothetical protein FB192DRAFT_1378493 [Mucor lusitanicus]|uniref:Vacuolar segregation protein 7 n=1 Tax=Mucor circinelloides f. lusitanicus TaxID=29924 RepID=A0A8H4BHU5_MUCCL|nr:hypothetical protein FB192DRAFT_1378493 [Mucor lusitanicus]